MPYSTFGSDFSGHKQESARETEGSFMLCSPSPRGTSQLLKWPGGGGWPETFWIFSLLTGPERPWGPPNSYFMCRVIFSPGVKQKNHETKQYQKSTMYILLHATIRLNGMIDLLSLRLHINAVSTTQVEWDENLLRMMRRAGMGRKRLWYIWR